MRKPNARSHMLAACGAAAASVSLADAQTTPSNVDMVREILSRPTVDESLAGLTDLTEREALSLTGVTHLHVQRALADAGSFMVRHATGAFGAPPNKGGVDRLGGSFFPEGGVQTADFGGGVALPSDAFRPQEDGVGLWASPFYVFADHDGDATAPGFESEMTGILAGYSRAFKDGRAVGISLGYADVDVTSDQGLGTGDATLISAGAFARYARGGWRARVAASYVYTILDTERTIDLVTAGGTPIVARTDDLYADEFSAFARAGYRFGRRPTSLFAFEPFFEASLGQWDREGFFEEDAGGFGLRSGDEDVLSLTLALGAQVQSEWTLGDVRIAPRLAGGFGAEALDRRTRSFVGFLGNSETVVTDDRPSDVFFDEFVIRSAELDRYYGFVGAGLEFQLGRIALSAGYDGLFAGDREVHVAKGSLGWRF